MLTHELRLITAGWLEGLSVARGRERLASRLERHFSLVIGVSAIFELSAFTKVHVELADGMVVRIFEPDPASLLYDLIVLSDLDLVLGRLAPNMLPKPAHPVLGIGELTCDEKRLVLSGLQRRHWIPLHLPYQ